MDNGPDWPKGEAPVRVMAGHVLDPVQLGVLARITGADPVNVCGQRASSPAKAGSPARAGLLQTNKPPPARAS